MSNNPNPRRQRLTDGEREAELAARKRVAALVSGGLHFRIKREGHQVQGTRSTSAAKLIARLTSKSFTPEVVLDLRGRPIEGFRDAIAGFISLHHRRGVQQMSILYDPSIVEEVDTTQEAILAGLTLGPAAALVRAFATARHTADVKAALALLLI